MRAVGYRKSLPIEDAGHRADADIGWAKRKHGRHGILSTGKYAVFQIGRYQVQSTAHRFGSPRKLNGRGCARFFYRKPQGIKDTAVGNVRPAIERVGSEKL